VVVWWSVRKGLAINQQNPDLLAVACGDPYVRLYDRRKLTLSEREGGGAGG